MTAVWIMVGEVLMATLLAAVAIWFAGRWLKYRRRGFGWALGTAATCMLLNVGACVAVLVGVAALGTIFVIGVALGEMVAEWGVVRMVQGTTEKRALIAWGAGMGARLVVVAIMLVGVRGRLVNAYRMPTMGMAPTLLGDHRIEKCPNCGGELLVDAADWRSLGLPGPQDWRMGICLQCGKATRVEESALHSKIEEGDRFMVSKFLALQRWDLVTFRHERDIYVKRLVGLPGEEISIDADGHVIVNGARARGPADKPEIVFHWPFTVREEMALRPGGKMLLGPGEYFVLGDFGENSSDSRYWGAVKQGDIDGVVTWIYWPLSRIRIVR